MDCSWEALPGIAGGNKNRSCDHWWMCVRERGWKREKQRETLGKSNGQKPSEKKKKKHKKTKLKVRGWVDSKKKKEKGGTSQWAENMTALQLCPPCLLKFRICHFRFLLYFWAMTGHQIKLLYFEIIVLGSHVIQLKLSRDLKSNCCTKLLHNILKVKQKSQTEHEITKNM